MTVQQASKLALVSCVVLGSGGCGVGEQGLQLMC